MPRRNATTWRDIVFGAALLFGVAAGTWYAVKPDAAVSRHLYIGGHSAHVDDDRIAAIAAPYLEASFFDVDIQALQAELQRQPWLREVSVARQWPAGVAVRVAEHEPVARWAEHGVLAADGTVFTPEDGQRPDGLIRLAGPPGSGLQVYRAYQQLARILAGQDVRLARLTLNARGSWTGRLASGLTLRLGREALAARLQRFVDYALASQKARDAVAGAGYVDLRYSDGFAVGGRRSIHDPDNDQEKTDDQTA